MVDLSWRFDEHTQYAPSYRKDGWKLHQRMKGQRNGKGPW